MLAPLKTAQKPAIFAKIAGFSADFCDFREKIRDCVGFENFF
jgi:hypothetical protein